MALAPVAVAAFLEGFVVEGARMVAARASHGPEDLEVHLLPRPLSFNRFLDVELPVIFPPYKLIGEQTCCILKVSLGVYGSVSFNEGRPLFVSMGPALVCVFFHQQRTPRTSKKH